VLKGGTRQTLTSISPSDGACRREHVPCACFGFAMCRGLGTRRKWLFAVCLWSAHGENGCLPSAFYCRVFSTRHTANSFFAVCPKKKHTTKIQAHGEQPFSCIECLVYTAFTRHVNATPWVAM